MVDAYPLAWPTGWKRTPASCRTPARFAKQTKTHRTWQDGSTTSWTGRREVTIAEGVDRVRGELLRMGFGDDDLVISTNLALRLDGRPRSNQTEPIDPGVSVYWRDRAETRCMAVDRYDRVADNLAAVAATLDAMRAIERHGGAEILHRAFSGFAALEGPRAHAEHWSLILGVARTASRADIDAAWRSLRGRLHPDRAGGSADAFTRASTAYEVACREVAP